MEMSTNPAYNKTVGMTVNTHTMLDEIAWRNRRSIRDQIEVLIKTEYNKYYSRNSPTPAEKEYGDKQEANNTK